MTHASRTSPGTEPAPRHRPLVLVATWTMDPGTIDPTARALLGIRTDPIATIYRLTPHLRTIADTHRVLARGGYDVGLHPLKAARPDHLELTPTRWTKAKSLMQDVFAESFLSGGCRAWGSGHHAASLEMSSIPSTDVDEMRSILLDILSAPILDADATSRLAASMAAIAAIDGTLEHPDGCMAAIPWNRGHMWTIEGKGARRFPTAYMDPAMDALLPHVIRIDPMRTEARPRLRLSPFAIHLGPGRMPDPITTIRTIERLRREPIT